MIRMAHFVNVLSVWEIMNLIKILFKYPSVVIISTKIALKNGGFTQEPLRTAHPAAMKYLRN